MNRNWIKGILVAAALGALAISAGCGGQAESSTATKPKITVAVEASYAPFEYKDEHNHLVGFDIDLMKAIAEEMKAEPEFHDMTFDDIFPAVGEKKMDLGISAIGVTEKRSQYVAFSDPYYSLGAYVILTRQGSGIHGEADLQGKVLAVEKGSTNEDQAKKLSPSKLVSTDTYEAVFQAVEKGEAEAAIVDEPGAAYYLEHNTDSKLAMAGAIPTSEQFVIIMAKENKDMQKKVNDALQKVIQNGTYDKLSQKWFFNKAQAEKE